MNPDITTAQAIAASILAWVEAFEAAHGPQPRLRHLLHMAQAEVEALLKVGAGSVTPDGGIPKNP